MRKRLRTKLILTLTFSLLAPRLLEAAELQTIDAITPLNFNLVPTEPVKERPLPRWPEAKRDPSLRIFPVLSDAKRTYVSLFGDGFSISTGLNEKLLKAQAKNTPPGDFFIDGALADEVLQELKISRDETLFWFRFSEPTEAKIQINQIKRLLIKPNGIGGEIFGALGIEVGAPGNNTPESLLAARGIAVIGKTNPLLPSPGKNPNWTATNIALPEDNLLDHVDFLAPKKREESREVKKPLQFQTTPLDEIELIQATAEFERLDPQIPDRLPEKLFGYFLRDKAGISTLYDFYLDTTYHRKPETILVGQWVKGFDATLYISSTGMGDCGRFVFVKDSTTVVIHVRCGVWGC